MAFAPFVALQTVLFPHDVPHVEVLARFISQPSLKPMLALQSL